MRHSLHELLLRAQERLRRYHTTSGPQERQPLLDGRQPIRRVEAFVRAHPVLLALIATGIAAHAVLFGTMSLRSSGTKATAQLICPKQVWAEPKKIEQALPVIEAAAPSSCSEPKRNAYPVEEATVPVMETEQLASSIPQAAAAPFPARAKEQITRRLPVAKERQQPVRITRIVPLPPKSDWMISGTWGPRPAACTKRSAARTGWLPMVISERQARSGDTVCAFRSRLRESYGWKVSASCSAPKAHWTSKVRLAVAGSKLIWASERGKEAYTRCERPIVVSSR